MKNECKRVLHVTEMLQAAGIESFIMNTYRNIDRNKVQFDFFVTRDEKEFYDDEIQSLGGKKFVVDIDKNINVFARVIKESIELKKVLKNEKYDIVHIHTGTPLRIFYLIAAKFGKVKTRIYHSHSAEVLGPHAMIGTKKIIFKILKHFFEYVGTDFFACSNAAAEWMYSSKLISNNSVEVVYNGIDLKRFEFNKDIRYDYRKKLGIENQFVIGHIGRFEEQKNHTFLIDIFNEIYISDSSARLLLIGKGDLEQEIRDKVVQYGLNDAVTFLGVRDDVNKIMQAMDVFLLPSNYEGLPVVGVEAQAAGLKMISSDNITKEVAITPNIEFVSLGKSAREWAEIILNVKENYIRNNTSELIKANGYDIKNIANKMEKFYLSK